MQLGELRDLVAGSETLDRFNGVNSTQVNQIICELQSLNDKVDKIIQCLANPYQIQAFDGDFQKSKESLKNAVCTHFGAENDLEQKIEKAIKSALTNFQRYFDR